MSGPDGSVITAAALREWRLDQPSGGKSSRGRIAILGGSPSTPGAVMLAGLAALRVGAGVLALGVAEQVAAAVAAAVPEASVQGLSFTADDGAVTTLTSRADALVVGPGIDDSSAAESVMKAVLAQVEDDTSLVVDAFALGVLPGMAGVDRLGGRAVLTPNPAEAARLLRVDDVDDRESAEVAGEIAKQYGCVVSFESSVAAPDGQAWSVPVGHPGLGTSGSGDVLAGAIGGLLARGADPAQAACWGTYLHAVSGDRLAARVGRLGFLARELVQELPLVIVETEA